MSKKENPSLSKIIHAVIAILSVLNLLVLIFLFTGVPPLGDYLKGLDSAVDAGIDRYVGRQEEEARNAQEVQQKEAAEKAESVPGLRESDHVVGSRDAEILLIEYSDFECPYCQRFHPTAQSVVDNSGGRVAWIYRHFPLSIHAGAQKKGEASECVAKLGDDEAFWKFSDVIFGEEFGSHKVEGLGAIASSIGIDADAFQNCLDSDEMAGRVQADFTEGASIGVIGTPGNILLNTKTGKVRLVPGAVPEATLNAAIEEVSS